MSFARLRLPALGGPAPATVEITPARLVAGEDGAHRWKSPLQVC